MNPKPTNEHIVATWDALDDDNLSTETLVQMVADACHCSTDDVAAALAEANEDGETET
jgi:hypothetical protein